MKNSILLLFLLATTLSLHAQREQTLFNGGFDLTGIWGGSTNQSISVNDDFNLAHGGFFAFEINENFLIGWAGYSDDVGRDGRSIDIKGHDLLIGYTFNSDRLIHPLFYLQTGSSKLEVSDTGSDNVFVMQPTVGAEMNIARFFRLGLDAGYRFVNDVELADFTNKDFSGPMVNLRLKFGWSW